MINWAIKTFDHIVVPDKWVPADKQAYTDFRFSIIQVLLREYRDHNLITPVEHDTLCNQLNSTDRDDWYVAFLVIKQLKNRKV